MCGSRSMCLESCVELTPEVEEGDALPDGGGGAAEDVALDGKAGTGQDYITQKHKK